LSRRETAITTIAYPEPSRVTVDVDPHGQVHVACALDQLGRQELVQGDLDGGWPNGPSVGGQRGGELVTGLRAASSERLEDAGGAGTPPHVGLEARSAGVVIMVQVELARFGAGGDAELGVDGRIN